MAGVEVLDVHVEAWPFYAYPPTAPVVSGRRTGGVVVEAMSVRVIAESREHAVTLAAGWRLGEEQRCQSENGHSSSRYCTWTGWMTDTATERVVSLTVALCETITHPLPAGVDPDGDGFYHPVTGDYVPDICMVDDLDAIAQAS